MREESSSPALEAKRKHRPINVITSSEDIHVSHVHEAGVIVKIDTETMFHSHLCTFAETRVEKGPKG